MVFPPSVLSPPPIITAASAFTVCFLPPIIAALSISPPKIWCPEPATIADSAAALLLASLSPPAMTTEPKPETVLFLPAKTPESWPSAILFSPPITTALSLLVWLFIPAKIPAFEKSPLILLLLPAIIAEFCPWLTMLLFKPPAIIE